MRKRLAGRSYSFRIASSGRPAALTRSAAQLTSALSAFDDPLTALVITLAGTPFSGPKPSPTNLTVNRGSCAGLTQSPAFGKNRLGRFRKSVFHAVAGTFPNGTSTTQTQDCANDSRMLFRPCASFSIRVGFAGTTMYREIASSSEKRYARRRSPSGFRKEKILGPSNSYRMSSGSISPNRPASTGIPSGSHITDPLQVVEVPPGGVGTGPHERHPCRTTTWYVMVLCPGLTWPFHVVVRAFPPQSNGLVPETFPPDERRLLQSA